MKRTATVVIVRVTKTTHEGEEVTINYGPFLPHAGSATTSFVRQMESDLEESGRYAAWNVSIEDVFIGEGESDCTVTH